MATVIRYHKQSTDGKLVPCPARIKCRLPESDHTNLTRDQALFMKDVMGVAVQIPRQKDVQASLRIGRSPETAQQVVPPTRVNAPDALDDLVRERVDAALAEREFEERTGLSREQFEELSEGPSQFDNHFLMSGDAAYTVGYNYDQYDTPEAYRELEDGYGRNRRYTGLRVDPDISAEAVAANLFGPRTLNAKAAAVAYVRANGLDQADAYEVEAKFGYYGQEAEVTMLPEKEAAARAWFYAFRNAGDENQLLSRARDLGIDTMGVAPEEALKKILKRTRPNVDWDQVKKLDRIEKIETRSLHTRKLKLTAADVAPYAATEIQRGDRAGIVLYDPVDSSYQLLEGHGNVRNLIDSPASQRRYIVATLKDTRARDWRGRVIGR